MFLFLLSTLDVDLIASFANFDDKFYFAHFVIVV